MLKINLANKLTLFRIILVPFFVVFLMADISFGSVWALLIFIAASVTDRIDGQIARKRCMITDFGKFLDPLADKILTTSALICFIELGWIPAWTVIAVVAREFIVSGVRLVAAGGAEKTVIAADFSGKLKTAVTMVSVIIILLMRIYVMLTVKDTPWYSSTSDFDYYNTLNIIRTVSDILIYVVTVLTVLSGIDYVWKYRAVFKGKM